MQIGKRLKLSALKKRKNPFRGNLFLPDIRMAVSSGDIEQLVEILREITMTDTAMLWHLFTEPEKKSIFDNICEEEKTELFEKVSLKQKSWFLKNLNSGQIKDLVESMSADERADLFLEVSGDDREKYFQNISEELKENVKNLAKYGSDTAGGLMSTDFIVCSSGMKVSAVMEKLRDSLRRKLRNIYAVYINDEEGKLMGGISLRRLLSLRGDERIDSHCNTTGYVAIPVAWDQEEAAHVFAAYDLLSCPVVDEAGKLIGVISVDDILDVINEEATEDMYSLAKIADAKEAAQIDFRTFTPWSLAKKRIPWLAVMLFLGAVISGQILKWNSKFIEELVILTAFIPILMGAGGNSGSQALVLFIRAVALKQATFKGFATVLTRELESSAIMGLILGAFGISSVLFIVGPGHSHFAALSLTVFLSLFLIIVFSSAIGVALPVIISKFKGDPAIISAPLLTALVDGVALIIYFELAKYIFTYFAGM